MQERPVQIAIVAPCYNEGATVIRFLRQLEAALGALPFFFTVIVVNDGSADDTAALLDGFCFAAGNVLLRVVSRAQNEGHQAAIYSGLAAAQLLQPQHCIVMDADGEDDPAIIPQLLMHREKDVVHVVRGERSASPLFRAGYACYKFLFHTITGRQMNYGNYCLMSSGMMDAAVAQGFRHLAAFLSKQDGSRGHITAARPPRIGGRSKMSMIKLMRHAAHSIIEYRTDTGATIPR